MIFFVMLFALPATVFFSMLIFLKVLSILASTATSLVQYLSITSKNTCDLLEMPAILPPPLNSAHGAAEMGQTDHHDGEADPR